MRIGISVCSNYRTSNPRDGARFMVERAQAANTADLDSLFVGDHHATPTHYYQNAPMLGRMLAAWNNKPAGALYLLPLWHPVLLAEQISTLASIMQGRFIMQCGLGGERRQFAAMGVDLADRVPMFEASLDIMRRLWAGEVVSHERFWGIENARISPVPEAQVEVWVGAVAPAAIRRAARLADGWLGQPSMDFEQAAQQADRYRAACADAGHEPNVIALRRDIYVGATSQEAQKVKTEHEQKGYRGFPQNSLLAGSVAQVADELATFAELGYTDVIVRNMSADQAAALATIERLAQVRQQLES